MKVFISKDELSEATDILDELKDKLERDTEEIEDMLRLGGNHFTTDDGKVYVEIQ